VYRELDDLNKTLEQKVEERTRQLEDRNRQIVASIHYAQTIQSSILPKEERMARYLSGYFTIWKPRDIVGGDFYWFEACKDNYLIAVGDCTGHGVPGALMTMTVSSSLGRVVEGTCSDNPARILKELNMLIRTGLNQDLKSTLSDDGLDIAVCCVMPAKREIIFSSAKIPIYYSIGDELNVIKGERQSIGYKRSKEDYEYSNHTIHLREDSVFYLATDGFIHQNGGEKDFSFGRKRFKDILAKNFKRPLEEQKRILEHELKSYQGNELQRDDITVFGFKI
jgi:serine phosphatase RsbU (regulator of sigma subunit)